MVLAPNKEVSCNNCGRVCDLESPTVSGNVALSLTASEAVGNHRGVIIGKSSYQLHFCCVCSGEVSNFLMSSRGYNHD
jgi:hypothetical protein